MATATALTNHGSVVSVPDRGSPQPTLPEPWSLDDAAAAVRARSLRLRPRLPAAVGHCVLIRRSALDLVGEFDLAFSPGYGEEVDFSQRCLHRGLSHVLADEVFVFHAGGASFSADGRRNPIQDAHERLLQARYPYYHAAVRATEQDVVGPLPRALSVARRALRGLSVLIDARVLAGTMTGTQLQILEVISALARAGSVRLSVVVPDNLSGYAAATLRALPAVTVLTRSRLSESVPDLVDLVHRPYQINSDEDLIFLARLGERLMVTNQDLIGYHNPSYFRQLREVAGLPPPDAIGAGGGRPGRVRLGARARGCPQRRPRRAGSGQRRAQRRRPHHRRRPHRCDRTARGHAPARRTPRRSSAWAPTSGTRTGSSR